MRKLLCILAFAAAGPAFADPPSSSVEATAASPARALIEQSGASGVFEALPADQFIAVRHRRSGLVCRLDPARANRLMLFPQSERGEDVACDSEGDGEAIRLYATRYTFETDIEQQLQGAVTAVQRLHPDLRAYAPFTASAPDGLPASRTAHFFFNAASGARLYSRISVAMIGDWVIKLRYTALAADAAAAQRAEQTSSMLWNATLGELTAQRT